MPKKQRLYFVYMMNSASRRALYTGFTFSIDFRVPQHKTASVKTFTGKYKAHRLVWYEIYHHAMTAIRREKEIKGWTREKKEALVNAMNPEWRDLSADWGKEIKKLERKEKNKDDEPKLKVLRAKTGRSG